MEPAAHGVATVLSKLPLSSIPIEEFDSWVSDGGAFLEGGLSSVAAAVGSSFSSSKNNVTASSSSSSSTMMVENDIEGDEEFEDVAEEIIAQLLRWKEAYEIALPSSSTTLTTDINSFKKNTNKTEYDIVDDEEDDIDNARATEIAAAAAAYADDATVLAQNAARTQFWDTLNAISSSSSSTTTRASRSSSSSSSSGSSSRSHLSRSLLMYVSQHMSKFLNASATTTLHSSPIGTDAIAAIRLYWAMVSMPGAHAHGMFESNVMRRALSVAKRCFELASVSGKGTSRARVVKASSAGGVGAGGAAKKSKVVAPPTPEGARRNPRRSQQQQSDLDAAEDQDEDEEKEEEDEGEENNGKNATAAAREKLERRAKSKPQQGKCKTGSASSVSSAEHIKFDPKDITRVLQILESVRTLLQDFALRSYQEFIPQVIDALAIVMTFPAHVTPHALPSSFSTAQVPQSNALVASASCMLMLLLPRHASPLITARLILKKLKPYMLHGHAGTASAASGGGLGNGGGNPLSLGNTEDDGFGGEVVIGDDTGMNDGEFVDITRPVSPPEPKVVRARALYLTRVLVSDKLSGRVSAPAADADPTTAEPIPNQVLVRLPAVTALLQHLCAGAVTARADIRSVTCDIVAHLRACLPHSLRRAFVRFVTKFGRGAKVSYRLLAVEVAGRLLGAGSSSGYGAAGVSEDAALDIGDDESADRSGGGGVARNAETSDGSIFSPILAIALSELPVPTAADRILESEGYGQEGAEYADAAKNVQAEAAAAAAAAATPASPGGDTAATGRTTFSGTSSSRRRSSIILMGADNAHTPMRTDRPDSQDAPGTGGSVASRRGFLHSARSSVMMSGGSRKSRGPGSPFYGTRRASMAGPGNATMADFSAAAAAADNDSAGDDNCDGCCDPRPTVTILLHFLHSRASDKSPAVRAKAISILASLVDPLSNPHARALALMLTHAAYTSAVATAAANAVLHPSDVTLADMTMAAAIAGSSAGYGVNSGVGGGSNSSSLSIPNVNLPSGVFVLQANGPSPIVPVLVRRMGDSKPAVRKAAVQAAISLALAGGTQILHAPVLIPTSEDEVQANVTGSAAGDNGEEDIANGMSAHLSWSTAQTIHANVYASARILASASSSSSSSSSSASSSSSMDGVFVVQGSRVLGLWTLQTICSKATDSSVSVRKAALSGVHALLMAEPTTAALQQLWLATVLPLVADAEMTVSARAVECTREAIVNGLLDWHAATKKYEKAVNAATSKAGGGNTTASSALPPSPPVLAWQLLDATSNNADLSRCLGAAISAMAKPPTAGMGTTSTSTAASLSSSSLPIETLMSALQQGASATETKAWNNKEGVMITAALDADTTIRLATDDGMLTEEALSSDDLDKSSADDDDPSKNTRVTAATFRRAAWLMLELLASHYASSTVTSGGMVVAGAGIPPTTTTSSSSSKSSGSSSSSITTAFAPMIPFLIRSWGTMVKALRASARIAAATNTTVDNNASLFVALGPSASSGSVSEALVADASRVLRILTLLSPTLKTDHAKGLVESVVAGLRSLTWEPALIAAGVRMAAVTAVSHATTPSITAVRIATDTWSVPVLAAVEEMLRAAAARPSAMDVEGVCDALFVLGEMGLVALDADAGQGVAEASVANSTSASTSASNASSTPSSRRLQPISISEKIVTLVQAFLAPTLSPIIANGNASSSSTSSTSSVAVADGIRAHAYLCLGKLCLRDGILAKRFISVLVRDLSPTSPTFAPPAVRNNILFALGDMCVRYTAMVDRHFGAMAESLADPSPLLRRHALVLITQLVTSDYLKWRGYLFYRFAAALADADEDVRNTAESAITGALLSKNRLLLQSHFVDLVFVLTGCTTHPAYAHLVAGNKKENKSSNHNNNANASHDNSNNKTKVSSIEDDGDEEEGGATGAEMAAAAIAAATMNASNKSEGDDEDDERAVLRSLVMHDAMRRMHVYRTLLSSMPEEQRFTVHGKLAVEVLNAVLEGTLRLTPRERLNVLMGSTLTSSSSSSSNGYGGQNMFNATSRMHALTPQASSKLESTHKTRFSSDDDDNAHEDDGFASVSQQPATVWFPLGTTEALVAEVFAILSSPDIRMGNNSSSSSSGRADANGADDDDFGGGGEEDGGVGAVIVQSVAQAKTRLLARVAKKQVTENVIPICVGLKQMLATARSPLMGPLMGYLATLFSDYGEEVKEVLSTNRQLAAELEFDLRMHNAGHLDVYGQPIQPAATVSGMNTTTTNNNNTTSMMNTNNKRGTPGTASSGNWIARTASTPVAAHMMGETEIVGVAGAGGTRGVDVSATPGVPRSSRVNVPNSSPSMTPGAAVAANTTTTFSPPTPGAVSAALLVDAVVNTTSTTSTTANTRNVLLNTPGLTPRAKAAAAKAISQEANGHPTAGGVNMNSSSGGGVGDDENKEPLQVNMTVDLRSEDDKKKNTKTKKVKKGSEDAEEQQQQGWKVEVQNEDEQGTEVAPPAAVQAGAGEAKKRSRGGK